MIGEIGIAPDVFELLTWRQVETYVRGYFMKLWRQRQMFRDLMHFIDTRINGDKAADPMDYMPLPWDEPEEPKPWTEEEIKDWKRRAEIAHNRFKAKQHGKS